MPRLLVLSLFAVTLTAQSRMYVCMVNSKGWVVGSRLRESGLFVKSAAGEWRHLGFNHPAINAIDFGVDPGRIFLAAGNGLIRTNAGEQWKILSGFEVTELRDLAVDRKAPGSVYFAHTAGLEVTRDGGKTFQRVRSRYAEAVRVDRTRAGHIVTGGEDGLEVSEDGGATWRTAGASGYSIMHIEQSPHDACFWLAATERGGLYASHDCGRTFEGAGPLAVGQNLYDIAFDATTPNRIAVAGWGVGIAVSEDGGKTWVSRAQGLPSHEVWSTTFDPDHAGRLYAGVHEEALYVSDDVGKTWRKEGLDGSIIYRMAWGAEVRK